MPDRALAAMRTRPWVFAAGLSLVLLIANVLAEPSFGDPDNWPAQLATLAPLALVAFASTPAIVSGGGGLDLSVGPLAVFANVLLVDKLLSGSLHSAAIAIPILLLAGAAIGAINGVLVATFRYVPVIATICTLFVLTGVTLAIGAGSVSAGDNWTQSLGDMVGPIPGAVLLMAAPILVWWLLGRAGYHRALYAVGGNDVTAFTAGIDVQAVRIGAYALGGMFASIAGIALTAQVQSSQSGSITFYVLVGLTAVALGGVPLTGGRGGLTGAFFGACTLYLIQSLLGSLNVSANWLNVVYGLMLLAGILLGALTLRYRNPSREAVA
jgi:ribose transport system permease protein